MVLISIILHKISIFYLILYGWSIFRVFTKILLFDQNFDLWSQFRFLTKLTYIYQQVHTILNSAFTSQDLNLRHFLWSRLKSYDLVLKFFLLGSTNENHFFGLWEGKTEVPPRKHLSGKHFTIRLKKKIFNKLGTVFSNNMKYLFVFVESWNK